MIETDHAVKVNMRANILELPAIDPVHETFTAVFVVHLYYIDPVLKDFRTDVTYTTANGSNVEKQCVITKAWRYSSSGTMRLRCTSGEKKELKPTSIKHIGQPNWDSDTSFRPALTFTNAIGNPQIVKHVRILEYCSVAGGHVFEKYKIEGTFAQRLQLQSMPFDKQVLRIRIESVEPVWRMQLAPLKNCRAGALGNGKGVPTEWHLDGDVNICGIDVPSARLMVWKLSENCSKSSADIVVHVRRVPDFYVFNVIVVNFVITFMTGAAFVYSPDDFRGRADIQFTILLTSVGYKKSTTSWLPHKSYLTFLDKYIIVNIMFQFVVIAQSFCAICFACTLVQDEDADWQDGSYRGDYSYRPPPARECWPRLDPLEKWFAILFYGAWVLVHLVFLICHVCGLTDCLFDTWDDIYTANDMSRELDVSYDQHPYSASPASAALSAASAALAAARAVLA
jgi:hypothetical protein